jgi:hypothetical protein
MAESSCSSEGEWEELVSAGSELNASPCLCLFCTEFNDGAPSALEHCKSVHGFQLAQLVSKLGEFWLVGVGNSNREGRRGVGSTDLHKNFP